MGCCSGKQPGGPPPPASPRPARAATPGTKNKPATPKPLEARAATAVSNAANKSGGLKPWMLDVTVIGKGSEPEVILPGECGGTEERYLLRVRYPEKHCHLWTVCRSDKELAKVFKPIVEKSKAKKLKKKLPDIPEIGKKEDLNATRGGGRSASPSAVGSPSKAAKEKAEKAAKKARDHAIGACKGRGKKWAELFNCVMQDRDQNFSGEEKFVKLLCAGVEVRDGGDWDLASVASSPDVNCTQRFKRALAASSASGTSFDPEKLSEAIVQPTSPQATQAKELQNCWQKDRQLGRGSFGVVMLGTLTKNAGDWKKGSQIAVKVIPIAGADEETIKEAEAESQIMQKMRHANIVGCIGHVITPGGQELQILAEFCGGGSVADKVKSAPKKKLDPLVIRRYTQDVLHGLEYLHNSEDKHPIIHRDIKGDNLLLSSPGKDAIVKLADFGCSKMVNKIRKIDEVTMMASVMQMGGATVGQQTMVGTPYFMAPEVVAPTDDGYSYPCDIWSLGCTIIEMAGSKAWEGHHENTFQLLYQIGQSTGPPSGIPNDIHPHLKNFLEKCCFVRDPGQRPAARALLFHPYITLPDKDLNSTFSGKPLKERA